MLRPILLLSCLAMLAACSDDPVQQPMMYQPMAFAPAPSFVAPAAPRVDTVYFALNSAALSAEAQQTLLFQLDWLRMHPQPGLIVEGYADDRGSEAYNHALGLRRAQAVRAFLIRNGVPAAAVGTVSFGKDRPAAFGTDEYSRSLNRRTVTSGR